MQPFLNKASAMLKWIRAGAVLSVGRNHNHILKTCSNLEHKSGCTLEIINAASFYLHPQAKWMLKCLCVSMIFFLHVTVAYFFFCLESLTWEKHFTQCNMLRSLPVSFSELPCWSLFFSPKTTAALSRPRRKHPLPNKGWPIRRSDQQTWRVYGALALCSPQCGRPSIPNALATVEQQLLAILCAITSMYRMRAILHTQFTNSFDETRL